MNSFFIRILGLCFFISVMGCSSQIKEIFQEDDENEVLQTVFDSSDQRVGDFRVGEIKKPESRPEESPEDAPKQKKPTKSEQRSKGSSQIEEGPDKKRPEVQTQKEAETKPKEPPHKREKISSNVEDAQEDQIYPEEFSDYDQRSKKLWESTSPIYYPGEKFVYDIKYLGITAAHIKISTGEVTEIAKRKAFHYKGVLKSASFYSAIYKMEDTIETYVDAKDQIPIRYSLIQRETGKEVDDLQLFDREKNKTFFFYKRIKDEELKEEEKEAYIPSYFHDTFSAMFFVRGLPMKIGDIYEFPIMTRAKLWLVKIEIDSVEEVKYRGEWVDAYRIEAETRFPEELSKERGNITFWVSKTERRKLLRFSADVRFGSIYGDLVDYSPGEKAIDPEEL